MTTTNRIRNGLGDNELLGTETSDSAPLGMVGEYKESTLGAGSAIALGNNAAANVVSMVLTPGDWDITGQVNFATNLATLTDLRMGASMASATLPTQPGGSGMAPEPLVVFSVSLSLVTNLFTLNSTSIRVSLDAPTTIYLVAKGAFVLGAITAYGTLRARRMR